MPKSTFMHPYGSGEHPEGMKKKKLMEVLEYANTGTNHKSIEMFSCSNKCDKYFKQQVLSQHKTSGSFIHLFIKKLD